jgi:limonene-1,2-epoxide hydrolase
VRLISCVAVAVAAVLAAGCGGAHTTAPDDVVRAWSRALNRGDDEAAARLFATDARVVQGDASVLLHTHAQALAFNAALPCAGRVTKLVRKGTVVTATFVLGERPGHTCDGPGQTATAVVEVKDGKITLWHQVPNPDTDTGKSA